MKSSILILDHDVSIANAVAERLTKERNGNGLAECISSETDLKLRLDQIGDRGATIFVNASFKPFPNADSLAFIGIERVIKKAIRVIWFSKHPVIAYGHISELEMSELAVGKIFQATVSHKYFALRRLTGSGDFSLEDLIASASPVASDAELRLLIQNYCLDEFCERLGSLKHSPLSKNNKLDSVAGRADLMACLHYLRRAVSGELINLALIDDGIRILTKFREKERAQAESRLRTIQSDVERVIRALKRRGDE